MKKILLSMLALVLCTVSSFAQEQMAFSADGYLYDQPSKSFCDYAYVTVGYSVGKAVATPSGETYCVPDVTVPSLGANKEWRGFFGATPVGGVEQEYFIYVTTDGSNPADKDNANRKTVWHYSATEKSLVIEPIAIKESCVVKAACVRLDKPYYYDENNKSLNGLGYDLPKAYSDFVEVVLATGFQSYIERFDFVEKKPTVGFKTDFCKNPINEPTNSFIKEAVVGISTEESISEDLSDYLWLACQHSVDGSAIKHEFDNGNKAPCEYAKTISQTSEVHAQLFMYASHGTLTEDGKIADQEWNAPLASKETVAKFTKLELTSADGVVYNHDSWVGDKEQFVLTWGTNVKNIEYDGDIYSVLTDGKSSFLVKNGELKENTTYYVGGKYSWKGLLNMSGFEDADNLYICKAEQDFNVTLAPQMYSAQNMSDVFDSHDNQPLINIAFPVKDFDAEAGTAKVGEESVEIVNIADIIAAIPADKPSLYNGEATLTGIIFGIKGHFYFYADAITQGPQLVVNAPEITLEKEKNVDSTKDLTITVNFNDYKIINPDLTEADVKLSGKAQLRTVDGKAIGEPLKFAGKSLDKPFKLTIARDQITPDLAYIVTVDKVTAHANPAILCKTEFDNASKSFVTKAPAILNQAISVFDGVVTATVLNVETVGINDESEIKLYNNATGEEVPFDGIDASGNKIILTVGDGGFSVDVPFVTGLNFGQYTLILGPEALTVDEFKNPKELRFEITAGDETDKARIDALSDLNRCWTVLKNAPVGVNIFQYLPATVKKFQTVVDEVLNEVLYTSNPLAAADDIKMANTKLLAALYNFRPTLPDVNKTYTIRTNYRVYDEEKDEMVPTLGKYLNIDGEKVVLSKTPSYIQFHMVENCFDEYYEALLHMDPTNERFGGNPDMWGRFCYAPYTWYLYNTTNRSYVYMEQSDLKHNEEWDFNYYNYVLTDNRRIASTFTFDTAGFNEWLMSAVNYIDESIHAYSQLPVLYHNDDVFTAGDYDKIDEIEDFEAYYWQMMDGKCAWYIEQVDEPEPLNIPEGYIALTDEAELEGQTVVLMNVDTEEFIYGNDAQNIAVADFETASASTNVVTSYKIEKADNGFLFRCVTPAGADYGLWGANPCYFNAQPNVGGVTFNLGKDQDVANGSTWSLTYDEDARAWIVQCVANEGYLAGSTTSTEVTAKWVICASTSNASSEEATSISSVEAAANASAIYNAAGARTNTLQKGLNIVKMANGQVKKVLVK